MPTSTGAPWAFGLTPAPDAPPPSPKIVPKSTLTERMWVWVCAGVSVLGEGVSEFLKMKTGPLLHPFVPPF